MMKSKSKTKTDTEIPPVDLKIPDKIETATFALG
jgi:hypothetical protein